MQQAPFIPLVIENPLLQAVVAVLMIIFTIAWMVSFWLQTGAIRNARESGHRYWLINPLAALAGYRRMKWKLYLWSVLVGLMSLGAMFVIAFLGESSGQDHGRPGSRPVQFTRGPLGTKQGC